MIAKTVFVNTNLKANHRRTIINEFQATVGTACKMATRMIGVFIIQANQPEPTLQNKKSPTSFDEGLHICNV